MARKIRVRYRAPSHVPLWKVMEEGGFLEKHGLQIELGSAVGRRKRAAEELLSGALDVVSGNHHNLYVRRALYGEPYVHIAQTNNRWRENHLVVADSLRGLEDLRGKRVGMDDYEGHSGLNVWLYLRLNGLEPGKDVELVTGAERGVDRAREVMAGKYEATFVREVERLGAEALGAKIIEVPTMPMIEGVTLTTTTTYVRSHEEEIRSLVRALIDAIHFFKTRQQETLGIVKRSCAELLRIDSEAEWACFYRVQAESLEAKPYPTLEAIRNVFALAAKRDPEIADFNPLTLWDLHYVREIDDSGYIDRLYRP
jgi:ABC-type nitrate/sulfonate/bicarbonate transport system substrate-binding protein